MANDQVVEKKRVSKGRKAGSVICNILGTLIIIAVILSMLPLFVPKIMGWEVFHVVSGSMEPEITVGSMVVVKPQDPETIESGDIIAYLSGDTPITHRVVENNLDEGTFITKGDANQEVDFTPVLHEKLIGKVFMNIPMMGQIQAMLTGVTGKIYLFVLIIAAVLLLIAGAKLNSPGRS